MKIEKIKLENFKAHKNREIILSDKNIIIGENGVGKSSIFHSIIFALFGEDSKSYIGVNRLENLIRYNSSYSNVEVDLGEYKIIRKIARNSSESKVVIERNGVIIASGVDVVKRKLKDILKINRFSKILDVLYIKQGDLGKYISMSGKVDLTNYLEKLFDIDMYSAMVKVLESTVKDIDKERGYLEREKVSLEKDIQELKKIIGDRNIEELERELENYKKLKEEYEKYSKALIEIKTLLSNIDNEILSKEEYYRIKEQELENISNKLREEITNIKAEIRNIQYKRISEEFIKKNIYELEKMKDQIAKEIESLDKSNINNSIEKLKKILDNIREFKSFYDIENKYKRLNDEIKNISESLSLYRNKVKEVERNIEILKGEHKVCPVCMRELSEDLHKSLLERYYKDLDDLKNKINYLEKELKEKNNIFLELDKKYKRYNFIKEKLLEDKVDINKLEFEEERILKELEDLNLKIRKIEEYEILLDSINYLKKMDLENALGKLEEDYNRIKKDLDEVKKKILVIENMKRNIQKVNNILNNLNVKDVKELEEKINVLQREIEKYSGIKPDIIRLYKDKIENYNKLIEKIKKYRKLSNNLQVLHDVLVKYVEEFRKIKANSLSEAFRYYFRMLYRYKDITDVSVELEEGRKNEKIFTIYVIRNIDGKEIKKEVNEAGLSGGQIKILDLAFRLALAHLIKSEFKVIMLDEPTESLDENVRSHLAELLNSIKDYQIILCTHDELFKEKMEGKVIPIERS